MLFSQARVPLSANLFRRVDVAPHLLPSRSPNVLELVFQSAFIRGKIIEEEHLGKDKHYELYNGDASRLWVRKAGYNYGWDWGPILMTGETRKCQSALRYHSPDTYLTTIAGPWRPIRLESYTARLTSLLADLRFSSPLQLLITSEFSSTAGHECP